MKQGALIFDERTDRYDIRFGLGDYYGEADVTAQIRYSNSAESCTLAPAPNYTEAG